MKFYIDETSGSHIVTTADTAPSGHLEVDEDRYNEFVQEADAARTAAKQAAVTEREAACNRVCEAMALALDLPIEDVRMALGVAH